MHQMVIDLEHHGLEDHDHDHHDDDPHLLSKRFISHAQHPRHFGALARADGRATGVGVCGDAIEVSLAVKDGRIVDIRHAPKGCTYTVACGSAMCGLAHGLTLEDALKLTPEDVAEELDGLPADHLHCASLVINTLGEAMDDYYQKIWGRGRNQEQRPVKPAAVSLILEKGNNIP